MKKICTFCLLGFCLLTSSVIAAEADQLSALQQENRLLQRQVKRLEAQVAAMREEMNSPGVDQVISGIGYIVGVFGIAGWVAVSRKKREGR